MQQVDRLERTHHHLEMRDPAVTIETDDVDAVELDAVDLVLEFEHRAGVVLPFAEIFEGRTGQGQRTHNYLQQKTNKRKAR